MSEMNPVVKEISLLDGVTLCQFSEGEHLLRQGDKIDCVYFLQDGLCCQYAIKETGEEHILMVQGGDDTAWSLLGVIYLFADEISGMNFEARSTCICYKIPKNTILQYLKQHSELLIELLKQSMNLYANTYEHLKYRWQGNTVGQLCQFLLDKAELKNDILIVGRFYTNIRISQFLGVHNITASRIIKSLKDIGIIKRDPQGIIVLQPDALQEYIAGEKKLNYYKNSNG